MTEVGGWSPDELRRFVVNTILSDPGAANPAPKLPTPVADGDVPVWDQASNKWLSSSVKPVEGRELSWHVGATPPLQPKLNDMWVYGGISGLYWQFIYDPTDATYPWKFIGGPPLSAYSETQASTTQYLSDMNLTIPRNGLYLLSGHNSAVAQPAVNTRFYWYQYFAISGSTLLGDPARAIDTQSPSDRVDVGHMLVKLHQAYTATAGTVLTHYITASNWDWVSFNRSFGILPVRVN